MSRGERLVDMIDCMPKWPAPWPGESVERYRAFALADLAYDMAEWEQEFSDILAPPSEPKETP